MKNIHYLYNLVKFNDPPIPLNTSLGSTEQAIYKAVDKNDKKKTVIPINLETDIFDKIKFDILLNKQISLHPVVSVTTYHLVGISNKITTEIIVFI